MLDLAHRCFTKSILSVVARSRKNLEVAKRCWGWGSGAAAAKAQLGQMSIVE